MPASVNDYDPNDPNDDGLSDGFSPAQSAAVGSATGGPKEAPQQHAEQQGYVPWSSFVSANQDVAQREANKLKGKVQGDVNKAQSELGDASEGYGAGIDSNYSQGRQAPGSATGPAPAKASAGPSSTSQPSSGSIQREPATDAYAGAAGAPPSGGPHGSTKKKKEPPGGQSPQAQPRSATGAPAAGNPWESFLGPQPDSSVGFSTASNPLGGPPAPPASSGTQAAPARASGGPPASAAVAPTTAGAPTPGDIYGVGRGSETRSHAGEMTRSAANGAGNVAHLNLAPSRLTGVAAGGQPTGSKDLESSMGAPAWSQLLGDTLKASKEANALGSEEGVQALLQHGNTGPATSAFDQLHGRNAFDAALINGQGQRDFADLARQYGGSQLEKQLVDAEKGSQDQWKRLQGDVAARQAQDRGPAPLPADQLPFTPGAPSPGSAPPIVIPAAPGVGDSGANGLDPGMVDQGKQAAAANGGKVVTSVRDQDPGPGWDKGAFGAQSPTINVWGKSPTEQASNWWGGAGGPFPGDSSIDAATWYALAMLTTQQRAQWWAQHGGK